MNMVREDENNSKRNAKIIANNKIEGDQSRFKETGVNESNDRGRWIAQIRPNGRGYKGW